MKHIKYCQQSTEMAKLMQR